MPEVNAAMLSTRGGNSRTAVLRGGALEVDRTVRVRRGTGIVQMSSSEAVRLKKVAAVRMALAAGNYHVPESAVAAKLVDVMLELWAEQHEHRHLNLDRRVVS